MSAVALPHCEVCKRRGLWGQLRIYNAIHWLCDMHMQEVHSHLVSMVQNHGKSDENGSHGPAVLPP